MRRGLALAFVVFLAAVTGAAGHATAADVTWRGYVSSDARFSIPGALEKSSTGEHPRFLRNETWLNLRTDLTQGRRVRATADVSLVFTGKRDAGTIDDLSIREKADPFRIESDALFVTFRDIGLTGLDISLGRMILPWGTGDMFNPTRKLNPLDVEDPIKFGESIANQMLVLEWSPGWYAEDDEGDAIFDEMIFQAVAVPIFRGSMLPDSGLVAFSEPRFARSRFHSDVMADLFRLQESFNRQGGDLSFDVSVDAPEIQLRNVQVGARVAFNLLGMDWSLSYYRGFDDMPRPESVYANDVVFPEAPAATSTDLIELVDGLCDEGVQCLTGAVAHNEIRLTYPRIQQLGVDVSTSIPFLAGMGLWAEVAVVFHDDLRLQVRTSDAVVPSPTNPNGVALGISGTKHAIEVEGGQFVKAVVGVDHSPFPWWYINVQYLHGFVDEFGSAYLDDYVVAGSDFKFFEDTLLLRLFAILCIQDQSAVLYPQITVSPFAAAELTLGALFYFGAEDTKFGSPLTGPSTLFLKAKMSF